MAYLLQNISPDEVYLTQGIHNSGGNIADMGVYAFEIPGQQSGHYCFIGGQVCFEQVIQQVVAFLLDRGIFIQNLPRQFGIRILKS